MKEDLGFGQVGEKDEKITVSEYDMRQTMMEVQKVRRVPFNKPVLVSLPCYRSLALMLYDTIANN